MGNLERSSIHGSVFDFGAGRHFQAFLKGRIYIYIDIDSIAIHERKHNSALHTIDDIREIGYGACHICMCVWYMTKLAVDALWTWRESNFYTVHILEHSN